VNHVAVVIAKRINRLLLDQANSNELKLAYVRGLISFLSAIADTVVFLFPQATLGKAEVSPRIFLTTWAITLWAFAIIWWLRRMWYTPTLGIMLSLSDGAIVFLIISGLSEVFRNSQPLVIANITAFCTLLAVTGAVRLSERSVALTTALALFNFGYAAWEFRLNPAITVFSGISIGTAGFLGGWIAQIVQKQVKSEVGKLMMERLLPSSVVQYAFEDPMGLVAEPRICNVTVLITDIRGFTKFAEKLSPVEVLASLNQFQGLLAQIVREYGGMVDKFMGDGMLAVFGAPEPLENHASQAILSAIAMVQAINDLNKVRLGIGIHSGTVVAGCLGYGDRLEFTVIGDTVNVASRLGGLTKELHQPIIISKATAERSQMPNLISLGAIAIRGREEPLEVFTVQNWHLS